MPKFTFMPVKKLTARETGPTLSATITSQGQLYLTETVMDIIGFGHDAVVLQLLADYDKKAIALKKITNLTLGDKETNQDASIRFLTPHKGVHSVSLMFSIAKLLTSMGISFEKPFRVELQKYADAWTGTEVYYFNPDKSLGEASGPSSRTRSSYTGGNKPMGEGTCGYCKHHVMSLAEHRPICHKREYMLNRYFRKPKKIVTVDGVGSPVVGNGSPSVGQFGSDR